MADSQQQPAKLIRAILIAQGATYRARYRWMTVHPEDVNLPKEQRRLVPMDLSDWTARMQIRPKHHDPTLMADLSTENGGITLDGEGHIDVRLDADISKPWTSRKGEWDLELYGPDGGDTVRFAMGTVAVSFEVTLDE